MSVAIVKEKGKRIRLFGRGKVPREGLNPRQEAQVWWDTMKTLELYKTVHFQFNCNLNVTRKELGNQSLVLYIYISLIDGREDQLISYFSNTNKIYKLQCKQSLALKSHMRCQQFFTQTTLHNFVAHTSSNRAYLNPNHSCYHTTRLIFAALQKQNVFHGAFI